MTTDDSVPVSCDDCDAVVTLVRRPRDGLYVECACGHRSIDVDDCCADNNLFEAFTMAGQITDKLATSNPMLRIEGQGNNE